MFFSSTISFLIVLIYVNITIKGGSKITKQNQKITKQTDNALQHKKVSNVCRLKTETPPYYNKGNFKVSTHVVSTVRRIIFAKSFLPLVWFRFCKAHGTESWFISISVIKKIQGYTLQNGCKQDFKEWTTGGMSKIFSKRPQWCQLLMLIHSTRK